MKQTELVEQTEQRKILLSEIDDLSDATGIPDSSFVKLAIRCNSIGPFEICSKLSDQELENVKRSLQVEFCVKQLYLKGSNSISELQTLFFDYGIIEEALKKYKDRMFDL